MFHSGDALKEINIMHALRFADLLSKSTYEPEAEKHKLWGQEIGILLPFFTLKIQKLNIT